MGESEREKRVQQLLREDQVRKFRARKQQKLDEMNTPGYVSKTNGQDKVYEHMTDKVLRDAALFPAMLWRGLGWLKKHSSRVVRDDIIHSLNVESTRVFSARPRLEAVQVLAGVDRDAIAILKAMNADEPEQAILGATLMIARWAEEGRIDPTGQAVLVSAVILEEARSDGQAEWHFREDTINQLADKGYKTAQFLGYL